MENQKLYQLSSAQLLNFMSWKYTVHKQIMNIPTSILVEAPIDIDLLRQAVEEAIRRNDSFGVRVIQQGKEVLQYFTDRKALILETIDFSGQTNEQMEAFFVKIARKPIPLYDQPLAKIYVIKSPDGAVGLFTCICHLMMDTWAISLFYKDVFAVYMSLKNNEPMPAPLKEFEPVLQKELEYRSSDRHKKDLDFWRQEIVSFGTPPAYTHVNGLIGLEKYRKVIRKPDYPFGKTAFLRTTARHEVLLVERQDVENMQEFCTQQNVPSMQLLFFVGLRTYLARVNRGARDVSIGHIVARRGTLEEKQSGGTRPLALFCRTTIDSEASFTDALQIVLEKQNAYYRHASTNTVEIMQMAHDEYGMKPYEGYCTTFFTFQSVPMNVGYDLKVRSQWYCNGTAAMSLYVTIMDDNGTGALRCYYEYLDKVIKAERVQECHRYMLNVIRAGMEDPSITMSKLMELPLTQ